MNKFKHIFVSFKGYQVKTKSQVKIQNTLKSKKEQSKDKDFHARNF